MRGFDRQNVETSALGVGLLMLAPASFHFGPLGPAFLGDAIMRTNLTGLLAAAALCVSGPLAAQDEADLFSKLDANKDGFVTSDEVQDAQKGLFERLLRNADKDSDKKLSKEEFQAGLKPDESPKQPLTAGQGFSGRPGNPAARPDARRAEEQFDQADANKDGKVSKDEVPESRREVFGQMVQRLNPGGDGLTKEQFVRGMMFMAQVGGAPPAAGRPNPANAPSREMFDALFDRTDSNSDGKLTKDEIPEERQGMRAVLERAGGDSLTKEQFISGMMAMAQFAGQPPRPAGAPPRPEGAPPGGGLFGALDTDRDGQLSTSEIVGAGTALLKLDRNGDGKLMPDEVFGPGGAPPPARPGEGRPGERRPGQRGLGGINPEEFRQRLREADSNNDGKISKDEAPPLVKDRFDRIDANSDGFIDESETRQMLRRMAEGAGRRPKSDNQ
jgi:Ca2+-binding EF-hand superfamily protein